MKKILVLTLVGVSAVASSFTPALAVKYNGASVYKATDNSITTVYIDGTAGSKVAVDLGQVTKTTSEPILPNLHPQGKHQLHRFNS
jgi:hypothetical protein